MKRCYNEHGMVVFWPGKDLVVSGACDFRWYHGSSPLHGVVITASFLHNNNVGEREILTRDKATFVLGREREVK